jgi:hypothetical protein
MPRKRGKHWWYDFSIKKERYRGSLPAARTKPEAREQEDRIRISVLDGTFGKKASLTLAEFIDQTFWPWAEANYSTPKLSHLHHTNSVRNGLGHLKLTDIGPLHIERFKRERLSAKTKHGGERKASTVNRDLQQLGSILEMARRNGLVEKNPARGVKLLRNDNQRTRYLTDDEERRVMDLYLLHEFQACGYLRAQHRNATGRNR